MQLRYIAIVLGAEMTFPEAEDDVVSPLTFAILKRQKPEVLRRFLAFAKCRNVNATSSDSLCPLVPDAMLMTIHPMYKGQLVLLLKAGLRPSLRGWCSKRYASPNAGHYYSLLHELRTIYKGIELRDLLSMLLRFDYLPNCCSSWKRAIGSDLWNESFGQTNLNVQGDS